MQCLLNFQELSDTEYNLKTPNQRSYYIVRKELQPAQFITTYPDETNTQLSISNGGAAGPGDKSADISKNIKVRVRPRKNQ